LTIVLATLLPVRLLRKAIAGDRFIDQIRNE
jgi:hypothetical protein